VCLFVCVFVCISINSIQVNLIMQSTLTMNAVKLL
jgi:hypothetical protein